MVLVWDLAQCAIPGARHITQDAIKLEYILPFDQVYALVLVNGVLKVGILLRYVGKKMLGRTAMVLLQYLNQAA
jgi:hypothetical protein